MKKATVIILSVLLCFTLAACGDSPEGSAENAPRQENYEGITFELPSSWEREDTDYGVSYYDPNAQIADSCTLNIIITPYDAELYTEAEKINMETEILASNRWNADITESDITVDGKNGKKVTYNQMESMDLPDGQNDKIKFRNTSIFITRDSQVIELGFVATKEYTDVDTIDRIINSIVL